MADRRVLWSERVGPEPVTEAVRHQLASALELRLRRHRDGEFVHAYRIIERSPAGVLVLQLRSSANGGTEIELVWTGPEQGFQHPLPPTGVGALRAQVRSEVERTLTSTSRDASLERGDGIEGLVTIRMLTGDDVLPRTSIARERLGVVTRAVAAAPAASLPSFARNDLVEVLSATTQTVRPGDVVRVPEAEVRLVEFDRRDAPDSSIALVYVLVDASFHMPTDTWPLVDDMVSRLAAKDGDGVPVRTRIGLSVIAFSDDVAIVRPMSALSRNLTVRRPDIQSRTANIGQALRLLSGLVVDDRDRLSALGERFIGSPVLVFLLTAGRFAGEWEAPFYSLMSQVHPRPVLVAFGVSGADETTLSAVTAGRYFVARDFTSDLDALRVSTDSLTAGLLDLRLSQSGELTIEVPDLMKGRSEGER